MCSQRGVLWRILVYRNMRKYRSVNLRKMPQTCGIYGGIPWLAILDEIRNKNRENVLSQTEALKQLDWSVIETQYV